jgi:hypothetical protein
VTLLFFIKGQKLTSHGRVLLSVLGLQLCIKVNGMQFVASIIMFWLCKITVGHKVPYTFLASYISG